MDISLANVYGGVQSFSALSADGSTYAVVCGEITAAGEKLPFGTHVFRVQGSTIQRIVLPEFFSGRVGATVESDGLYLTYTPNKSVLRRIKVPGFVPAGANVQNVQGTPIVIPQVDAALQARVNNIQNELDSLKRKVSELSNQPASVSVSDQHIADISWSKANDAIYAQIQDANSPLMVTIWQKAKDAAYGLLKNYRII